MTKKRVMKMTQFTILSSLAVVLAMCISGPAAQAASSGVAAIEKAAKENKYLFIFFWKEDTQQSRVMRSVFQTALTKLTDKAQSFEIQADDPAEQQIVTRYGVSRAPMPLVLAIAPNGAVTKGFPTRFDENQLQQAFVSPCTAKCMRAIQDRHVILLCVQNGKTQFNQEAMQGVEAFKTDPQYAQTTEIVMLNPADNAEQTFLKALQVDPGTTAAVTLLVTPPGAPVASFEGAVTKEQIAAKLKSAQSSCCPGGKCGPKK